MEVWTDRLHIFALHSERLTKQVSPYAIFRLPSQIPGPSCEYVEDNYEGESRRIVHDCAQDKEAKLRCIGNQAGPEDG